MWNKNPRFQEKSLTWDFPFTIPYMLYQQSTFAVPQRRELKLLTLQLISLNPYRRISPSVRLVEECLQTAFRLLTPDVTFCTRSLTCPSQPFVRITGSLWQEGISACPLVQPPAQCRVNYEVWTVCSPMF